MGLILLVIVLYAFYSYREFAAAIDKAHGRLAPGVVSQLAPGDALGQPQVTLVVFDRGAGLNQERQLFSAVLMRTNPGARSSLLGIPTRLVLPDTSGPLDASRIYTRRGLSGLLRALQRGTGVSVSHVVQIDVEGIGGLIDQVGGVTIRNPLAIPAGPGHGSYPRGRIDLDGARVVEFLTIHRPLNVQSFVQLAVIRDFTHRLLHPSALLHLPSIGRAIARPLATDLSAADMLRLGWVGFRSSGTTECHLGGAPSFVAGRKVVSGSEDNARVVQVFLGTAPPSGSTALLSQAPGCGDVRPSHTKVIEPSNCGARADGGCPMPPTTHTRERTPLLVWQPYPDARAYGVRVRSRAPVYTKEPHYRITPPLRRGEDTRVFIYAYTRDHPAGIAIGTALIHPAGRKFAD